MLKDLGSIPAVFPMPVLMVATYGEDGTIDVMNVAWGGICGMDKIALNLAPERKTLKNIRARKAFTVSLADEAHVKEADFLGTASGNVMADKFQRTGLHAVKSSKVDAGKLGAVMFDQFRNTYYTAGKEIAHAWRVGAEYMKK